MFLFGFLVIEYLSVNAFDYGFFKNLIEYEAHSSEYDNNKISLRTCIIVRKDFKSTKMQCMDKIIVFEEISKSLYCRG